MMNYEMNEFDPRLKKAIWEGRIDEGSGEKIAILNSIVSGESRTFLFTLKDQAAVQSSSLLKRLWNSIRPFSLTATATPGLLVLGAGMVIDGGNPDLLLFALSLLSVVFLQAAVNVFNDVYDHVRGIDFPGDIGGSGVIQKGWISAQSLFTFASILCVFAILLGIWPVISAWRNIGWIVALGFVGGMGYSGLGLGFKYRALGDGVVFVLCGPALAMGFSFVTFGGVSPSAIWVGVIFGLASLGILHANNLNDLEIDQERGARTVANRIGFKRSQKYFASIYYAIYLASFFAVLTLQVPLWFLFAPALIAPMVLKMVNRVSLASGPLSPSLSLIRFETAKTHLLLGLGHLAVLVAVGLWRSL